MRLELLGDKSFVARSNYDERDIPKQAGFRWNPAQKIWWTNDPVSAAKLGQYADEAARALLADLINQRTAAIEASRQTDADINVPVPDGLSYMPFQRAGIAYAMGRPSTLISDEMGLGKTIQAIGVINADPNIKNVLVICPASLKLNWAREMKRWLTRPLSVEIANGSFPAAEIVILNYDILKKHLPAIHAREWQLLIADECHYLKNYKAQRTQYVLGKKSAGIEAIKAARKLFLTGTPIVNRPIELHPLAAALNPAEFGNWRKYVTRYCNGQQTRWGWDVSGASHLDELQEKLRATIMVRRLKKDVLTELPPKRRQIIELTTNGAARVVEAERRAWEATEARTNNLRAAVELAKASDNPQDYDNAVNALKVGAQAAFTEISKLRHDTAVAKIPGMVEFIHNAMDEDDKKIVFFAHHHDVINQIAAEFGDMAVVLTGETKMTDRQEAVDRFQSDPSVRLFVGSIQAAGVGLTLTASSHVIFGELDWVPGNVTQAEDRTHRIGQLNSVLVQHLVLDGSLDATMARTLVAKQEVIDQALDRETDVNIVIPAAEEPATAVVSRKKIIEEAEALTPDEILSIHQGLQRLSAMCDGAVSLDGMGFNKIDAPIGHSLARSPQLTAKQAALGKRLVRKYHRQLEG